jgi:hypothetical protein
VQQNLALVAINLAYVVSVDQNGPCLCKEAQGEFPQDLVLPYNFVSNHIMLSRLDQLNCTNKIKVKKVDYSTLK